MALQDNFMTEQCCPLGDTLAAGCVLCKHFYYDVSIFILMQTGGRERERQTGRVTERRERTNEQMNLYFITVTALDTEGERERE